MVFLGCDTAGMKFIPLLVYEAALDRFIITHSSTYFAAKAFNNLHTSPKTTLIAYCKAKNVLYHRLHSSHSGLGRLAAM